MERHCGRFHRDPAIRVFSHVRGGPPALTEPSGLGGPLAGRGGIGRSPGRAPPPNPPAGAAAAALQEASDVLETDIVEVCRDGKALDRTEVVQTAVFACDLAAWRLLESAGVEPAAVAGHSLGEFVALVAAG